MRAALFISLSLHVIIIGILVYLFLPNSLTQTGDRKIVSVYLTQLPAMIKTISSNNQSIIHRINKAQHGTTGLKQLTIHNPIHSSLSINKAGQYNKLLILLHNKVQQQINNENYLVPDFLKGKSTQLNFSLSPQGVIKNIIVKQSSGLKSLDQLAVQAMQNSQLPQADQFIKTTQQFTIKIVFN